MNQAVQSKYSQEYSTETYGEEDFSSDYGFDSAQGADPYGDSFSAGDNGLQDPSAQDLLKELTLQAKSGNLTPEQQKKVLDELRSLDLQLKQIGTVDTAFEARSMESVQEKLGQVESDLLEGQSNFDKVNTFSQELTQLKKELTENKYIPAETRKELEKRIAEIEKQMGEDFSFNPEDVKEGVQEIKDQLEVTKDFDAEAKRTEGFAAQLSATANSMFSTTGGIVAGEDHNVAAILAGAGAGAVAGGLIGGASLTAGAYTISALGGPVGWAIGGSILTASLVGGLLSEGDAPKSALKNLPEHGRDLDLIMKGKSGLTNTQAPGQIINALYDMSLSPEEQQKKIQEALMSYPPASQAYLLSTVTNLIAAKDPGKLTFLKEKAPNVTRYMSQAISTGQGSIQAGEAAGSGESDGYSVKFDGMNYEICNENTHWYTNDWDNRKINLDLITAPMGNALSALGGMGGGAPTPSTSYSNVPQTSTPTA